MKTVAYIPIKTNNERLPNKNTLRFCDGTPLIHFIQRTLLQIDEIDEIYMFCSDDNIREYCLDGVDFIMRPKYLDTSSATPQDIMREFISTVESDIYLTAHATSPFVSVAHIDECVKMVKYAEFDSAFTAKRLNKLLWNHSAQPVNFNPAQIPRTQDLPSIYAEVSAAYVFEKEIFTKYNRRIGINPKIIEVGDIEALDIDYPEDFKVANAIYKEILLSKN